MSTTSKKTARRTLAALILTTGGGAWGASDAALNWNAAKHLGDVDERFQSFNVEMVEVTGGRFWAPYAAGSQAAAQAAATQAAPPAGSKKQEGFAALGDQQSMQAFAQNLFQYRPPLDMDDQRLRNLTKPLAPAYMRVSGTWANKTFFDATAKTPPAQSPAGFESVLTAAQWDGANRFAKDLDLKIMTSFAVSPGTRNEKGQWTTDNARQLIEYSLARGYPLAAAEFINEPNTGEMAGIPKNYTAEAFRTEYTQLRSLRDKLIPGMLLAGPGTSAGDSPMVADLPVKLSPSGEAILETTAPAFDIVSYHFYPATSVRCAPFGMPQTSKDAALSESFLALIDQEALHFKALRDRFQPGKPIWLSEAAGAACGGNPWSVEFIDTFRYVEQLGRLAKIGVAVVMHNTLSASDYGLIDETTLEPRPSYWAAVLWRQLLGERVLDLPLSKPVENVSVYAHCLRGDRNGGVAVEAVNRNADRGVALDVGKAAVDRYELTAPTLAAKQVQLNGAALAVDSQGQFSPLQPVRAAGPGSLKPASINYLVLRDAGVAACR